MKWLFRLWQDLNRALARPDVRRFLGALVLLWLCDRTVYFLTETHWQHAVGFGTAWQTRIKAQLLLFVTAFAGTLLISLFLKPLWSLPADPPRLPPAYTWVERRLRIWMRFDKRVVVLLLLWCALWNGTRAASHWPQWLLFLSGDSWGYQAPLWTHDVSWWTFDLPFWQLLIDVLWRALSLVFFCGLLLSISRGAARFFGRRPALPSRALQNLMLLGIALLLMRGVHFVLMPLSEMSSSVLDAALWNGRRPAWWLSALLQGWPLALLLSSLVKHRLPARSFVLSLAMAFLAPPFLLWTLARLGPLISDHDAFLVARHTATRRAWNLGTVKVEQWQPLKAPRMPPQNREWLKRLRFEEDVTIIKEGGPAISLSSAFRRFLWAWRQRDLTLLRETEHFAPRRTLAAQRVALAPFLLPGNAARRLEIEGQVFHLQELLVATDTFPGSSFEAIEIEGKTQSINSAHPAVLLVQQVPSGSIKFYTLQESPDALTRAWQKALPGLILPFDSLPQTLPKQRRYPAELLKRQAHQLSEITDSNWHMTRQRGPSGWLQMQEPVFAFLPADEKFSFMAQVALCSDTSGQTLAALLQAQCEDENFGQLSLLRFENQNSSLAPLDSGLVGPDIMAERLQASLPQRTDETSPAMSSNNQQKAAPQWTIGMAMPVAIQNHIWLLQPIWGQRQNTRVLAGLAILNAAWGDGPIGIGRTAQAAQADWERLAPKWQDSDEMQQHQSLINRLRLLLQPGKVKQEAEVAFLIELAAKLHQAAQQAEKTDPAEARLLRSKQGQILQKLQLLMRKTANEAS